MFLLQSIDEVNRGNIRADGRLYELKALQDAKKASEYLTLARTLPGYGDVVFPHCACDSRKEGHVIPVIGELDCTYFAYIYRSLGSCKKSRNKNKNSFRLLENTYSNI